ncbi:MAG: MFS transporter [Cytophagaceae bacterium]|nr:MFS transporter [Cytophagaceae bacterium]MBK9934271.1 MFS transporter [Cytophagaceae bacterium]MBL0300723.1 MFS transporter [Cytophagaceae bacterium]MBL0327665.1 MFS transporter [Cytophagaceae bacterium]
MQQKNIRLGLKENWKQFTLLVIVNAFVGGMVGLERTIFPEFAFENFGISSYVAILSFITAFGLSKAITNYFAGKLANSFGRKNLLILGWIIALPIPFMLIYAESWYVVVLSNGLLGISQGFTWSSTVVMKIDLAGEKDRGLAMGLNEFAGYLSVGIFAWLTGYIANRFGIIPYPFYLGILLSVFGLLLSVFFVNDTRVFTHQENKTSPGKALGNIFWETTLKNKTLSTVTQAGLVNNLNDGMIWGLLPILLFQYRLNIADIGLITATYPVVWGIGQLFTGKMSDHYSKKSMLFWGMMLQGIAILGFLFLQKFMYLISLSVILGIGTALVYPTFLSTIAATTPPLQRAESIGTFRLWRDLGYSIGAIVSGVLSDIWGLPIAIAFIGLLTILSAVVIKFRMPNAIP